MYEVVYKNKLYLIGKPKEISDYFKQKQEKYKTVNELLISLSSQTYDLS